MKKQPFDDAPARSGPLISFYETTLISSRAGKTPVGVQVLASPPEIEGVRIRYENLLEDIASAGSLRRAESRPDDYFGLRRVLSVVADPELARYTEREDWFADVLAGELPPHRLVSDRLVVRLLENPLVAAEASPFGKRSLAELLGLGAFVGVGVVTGIPFVVITGGSVGLIVVRGLTAVGGALWEGAREEVSEFGGDVASTVLDSLRNKLGIKRRQPTRV